MQSLSISAIIALLLAATASAQTDSLAGAAVVVDIQGAIGPTTANYVGGAIVNAVNADAAAIILRLDTPGGLDRSMREIISAMLSSPVPVVAWVGPAGARADSAGTFIVYASHIAAMAPTTHLGAATPVNLIGGDTPGATPPTAGDALPEDDPETAPEEAPASAMERKVLNDAVAYIRGLAQTRGRNADWAAAAVIDAATLTADEALASNVIELLATDLPTLLETIDGRTVTLDSGDTVTLATASVPVVVIEKTWQQRFLDRIASPEIAILLFFAGIYGLIFEGWNPGALVPGIAGAICLLLAAYALNVLEVNYAGIALIALGIVLITAEIFVPSFGALGIGGLISTVIGAIMAFDNGVPGLGISRTFIASVAAAGAATIFVTGFLAARVQRRGAVSGREQILKSTAVAADAFIDTGTVWLEGEQWAARSTVPIKSGDPLRVIAIDGLTLDVEPLRTRPDQTATD
ncbi:MAG: nodulation protein NfeD [Pseudomonadota bacterium]